MNAPITSFRDPEALSGPAYYFSAGDLMWSAGYGTRLSRTMFENLLKLSEREGDRALAHQLRTALEAHDKWSRCMDRGVSVSDRCAA